MLKMNRDKDKQLIIIDKALAKYRDEAVRQVRRSICVLCKDRRCEKGKPCKAYDELVRSTAWDMVSHENN